MTRKLRFVGLLAITLFAGQTNAFAWGNLGHNAVGLVAEKVLTEKSRAKVREILGGNATLQSVSTWADMVRRLDSWKHTSWYHFTNTPENINYANNLKNLSSGERLKGDAVLAMVKAENVLLSNSADASEKRAALAFLVHFLGDIHQPYHSGRAEDRGANSIPVRWMGQSTNLHSVWDVKLIQSRFSELNGMPAETAALEYLELVDKSTPSQQRAWMRGYFDSWLDESADARVEPYSGFDRNQDAYLRTYIEVVNKRILQAGYRLGALLNTYFDPASVQVISEHSASARSFHGTATQELGANYLDRVVLKPVAKANAAEFALIRSIKEEAPDCPDEVHRDDSSHQH